MKGSLDMLQLMRALGKVYDAVLESPRKEYDLSQIETKVLSFLSNNPDKDTAADISYIRMLPKGNVSQAVDSLIKKGLLEKTADERDKRKHHLRLTAYAGEVVSKIHHANQEYQKVIYKGLAQEEFELYMKINNKIMQNIMEELEERNEAE